jgi:alkanesulfonate monooxygenase
MAAPQNETAGPSIELFSTCPAISGGADAGYLRRVGDVAQWSDRAGYRGILVYTDNRLLDPWLLAQISIQRTARLCPLVAVQPVYMHPYTVAKLVTSLAQLYGRRVYLNMVAGGFVNDLAGLNDATAHDDRYDRLLEYTTIIEMLLRSPLPASYDGRFYSIDRVKLIPPLPSDLFPGIFVSGSSAAGLATAKALDATAVKYPKPASDGETAVAGDGSACGIRVGIIARDREEEAWAVARERFPIDRKGQLTQQLAMKVSDSVWHKQLSDMAGKTENGPYWLVPFQNYKTFCPYLVGSYQRVAAELTRYVMLGYRTFILDVPPDEEEIHHTQVTFARAVADAETGAAA